MQHYRAIDDITLEEPTAIAIGVFDGVHRGHQQIVGSVVSYARENGMVPVVVTFDPHPVEIIKGPQTNFYLSSVEQKAKILQQLGVEIVITSKFDEEARQMRASKFLDMLQNNLQMRSLRVGRDFAMGYKREGNIDFLEKEAAKRNYSLFVVDDVMIDGQRISSSRIRARLGDGQVEEAERLLGRPYELTGTVVTGERRGRTIGFPTANLGYDEAHVVPGRGVYAIWVTVNGVRYPAVVNVGFRPTFNELPDTRIEAHLLDFDADIYGAEVSFEFLKRLRPERKFDSPQALIAQIGKDVEAARSIFAQLPTI